MTDDVTGPCAEVLEELALLVDGNEEAVDRYADHLADCDHCRDALHDARQAARVVVDAGKDYQPPEDLEDKVLAAIDELDEEPEADGEAAAPTVAGGVVVTDGDKDGATGAKPAKRPKWASWVMAAAAALLVVAGGVGIWMSNSSKNDGQGGAEERAAGEAAGTSAAVAQIVRAASDGESGLQVRAAGTDRFEPATADSEIGPGATVRTDNRTRARITLDEGTVLVLNHETELTFDEQTPRLMRLTEGELLADVTHLDDGPNATFEVPTGRVEVIGTKLVLTATDDLASVRVTRGQVRVHGSDGGSAEVKSGEEGLISRQGGLSVAPAVDLAGSIRWSELGGDDVQGAEVTMTGIGELRAKRPGEREAVERPLTLSQHKVRVRIVGNVARTEVEEVFRNDSAHTLEGIYRFPMPPDARIASLALDVEGRMEQGAFVEREVAAKIWRGVIRRATPVPQRRVEQQEFIWVPGPWRDPALLEWQRGGRFELRIFPIPARGERRVTIAYDQTVQPHGRGRRYVYPLPHSADASTRIGQFDADIRVAGADPTRPVASHGYGMQSRRDGDATRMAFSQAGFLPAGDLVIDYELENSDSEMRYWTYQGPAAAAPSVEGRGAGRRRGSTPEVVAAQKAVAADLRPYVAFAIRPELPVRTAAQRQDYVIVVDSSQSMVGERYSRTIQLVTGLVAEMDRRDRFTLMACDATCRTLDGGLRAPSSQAAMEVRDWLTGIRPAGASDLIATVRAAASAPGAGTTEGRGVRVLYIGDGQATVGHRRAGAVASAVRRVAQSSSVRFTTVGIGGDSDAMVLGAMARAGGGHYVPFVPGQRASAAALAVLETTYGVILENATVELPEGVSDEAPAQLPTIRSGEEIILVGRFNGEVQGEVVLRGTVGGEAYVDRYPVHLTPSTSAGNAFVPRLWAAATINDMQLSERGSDRDRVIALSRAYGVMSRHTSLLVLESAAMFEAFGIDRARPTVDWSGEDDADMAESDGTAEHSGATVMTASRSKSSGGGRRARRSAGPGYGGGGAASAVDDVMAGAMRAGEDRDRADQSAPMARPSRAVGRGSLGSIAPSPPIDPRRRGGRWMRRVWTRVGSVNTSWSPTPRESSRVAEAEAALAAAPDSRDRHRDLVRALARTGQLERARDVAEQWVTRDQLDPEALIHLSDILGRMGNGVESLRMLTGIVDLRPDEVALHERLVAAFERAGMPRRACSHRVAIAEIEGDDSTAMGAALRCERSIGEAELAGQLLEFLSDPAARTRAERAATTPPRTRPIRGDLMVEATWASGQDLDVSIVNSRGTRISWMGGRSNVVGESSRTPGSERLGLRWTPRGSYVIEISRTSPEDMTPISGQLRIRVLGQSRTVPFTLMTDRAAVARVSVRRESRLVPGM